MRRCGQMGCGSVRVRWFLFVTTYQDAAVGSEDGHHDIRESLGILGVVMLGFLKGIMCGLIGKLYPDVTTRGPYMFGFEQIGFETSVITTEYDTPLIGILTGDLKGVTGLDGDILG